jgi:hypothetical protein
MILSAALLSVALAVPAPSARPVEDPPPPAGKLILVPGTRVYVAPPAGHAPGRGYLGFTWPEDGSSLAIKEMRGAYADSVKDMNAESLARNGMTVLSTAEVEISGRPARLCHVTQKQRDLTVRKWLAATGDDKRTLLLTAAYVDVLDGKLSEPMKNALLGAVWDPSLDVDPFVIVPWSIEKPAGMRFADQTGMMFVFTEDGDPATEATPGKAQVSVGPVLGEIPVADLRSATEEKARKLAQVGETLEIESSAALDAGGRKGWEVVGKARAGEAPVLVHVVVLTGPGDHVLLTGQCALDRRETWLPTLRASARSWKLRPKPAEDKPAPK